MTAVQCHLCELRFRNRNERDWHVRNEHRHRRPTPTPTQLWAAGQARRPDTDRRG